MAETAVKEKANGIPVPEEGTEEFARMNKMAKIAIPIVLIIFTMGVLQQQAFGMIYVNIGDQLGQANLAPRAASLRRRYEQEFGEEFSRLRRKRIIPFIY